MLYQVTITKSGAVEDVVKIKADNARAAIDKLEATYKKVRMQLSTKSGVATVAWSGLEFEARRLAQN